MENAENRSFSYKNMKKTHPIFRKLSLGGYSPGFIKTIQGWSCRRCSSGRYSPGAVALAGWSCRGRSPGRYSPGAVALAGWSCRGRSPGRYSPVSGLVLLARPRLKAGSLVRLCLTLRKGSALGKRPARRYRPPRLPRSPGEKTLANYALRYAFFIFSARSAPQLHTPHFTLYLPASGSVISVYLHVVVGEVTAPGFCGSVAKMKIDIYKNLVGRENSRRRLF